jgi:hypothetical protein
MLEDKTPEQIAAEEQVRAAEEAKKKAAEEEAQRADEARHREIQSRVNVPITKTVYSPDEVQSMLAEAVKQGAKISKDQLHKEIDNARDNARKLQEKVTALEQAQKDAVTAQSKQEADDQASAMRAELEKVTNKMAALEDAYVSQNAKLEETTARLQKEKLATYAQQKVAEANGRIIAEMVHGNSVKEIDDAAAKAKAKFDEIEAGLKQSLKLPGATQGHDGKKENEQQADNDEGDVTIIERAEIKSFADREQYKNKRAELMKRVYAEAGFPVQ